MIIKFYNHISAFKLTIIEKLIEKMDKEGRESPEFLTGSDCEIILHLVSESCIIKL